MPGGMPLQPVVGVSTNVRQLPDYKVHGATERSIHAVYDAAGCLPLMLPALGDKYDFANLVERLDGLLLTGGASHVAPAHYSADDDLDPALKDPERDATTLPLIRVALAAGVPILALCRGIQELNVALGGTLSTVDNIQLHSSDAQDPATRLPLREWLVQHKHSAIVQPNGLLKTLFNGTPTLQINSAHSQAIAALSPKLQIEALAPDGVIEAVSVIGSTAFALGVQWHPEYLFGTDQASRVILEAFGTAARHRLAQRMLRQDWTARLDDDPKFGANTGS